MANTYLQMHIHKCFGALHLKWFKNGIELQMFSGSAAELKKHGKYDRFSAPMIFVENKNHHQN